MTKGKKIDVDALKKNAEAKKTIAADFQELLENSKDVDAKQKMLWFEIYKNAVEDRANASILFVSAYEATGTSAVDHVTMGATLTKYMEKMNRANQQLLDLSSQISAAQKNSEKIDPDELFRRIAEGNEGNDD